MNGRNCLHIAAYHGDHNLPRIINFVQNVDAQVCYYYCELPFTVICCNFFHTLTL